MQSEYLLPCFPGRVRAGQSKRYANACIVVFLLIAALAAYWPVLDHGFVDFDDPLYVTENAMLQQGLNLQTIRWAFVSNHAYNWHPVTWLSLLLDFELFRLKPMGYHLSNLLLHIANTILLFVVLRRMTKNTWSSAFAAALFGLHPLHVESVAWISERKDVLSAFFFMLTLWAYAWYAERPRVGTYLLVLELFAAGLMAKPMLVSLPLVLILLDYWPLQRLWPAAGIAATRRPSWRLLVLEKAPLAVLSVIACAITFIVQHSTGAVGSFTQYPLGIRIANAALAYQNYLANMVWPTHLACLYPYELNLPGWKIALAGIFLFVISAIALLFRRRAPWLIAGWLWYLITLVPVIGLVQVGNQAMADRYTYIPLIGIFIIIAWGAHSIARFLFLGQRLKQAAPAGLAVLACVIVILCGIGTWFQARTWKDTVTVFEHALAVTRHNYLAHNNLANVLPGRGRPDDAIFHYSEALRIRPNYAEAHNNIGVVLARQGRVDEAVAHYREALHLRPDCAETYVNLGTIVFNRGNLDEAAGLFDQALRINPYLANAYYNLGVVLAQKGLLADAVNHYVAALEIRPDMPDAYNNLIVALVSCGEYGKAMIAFRAAARLYRDWPPGMTGNLRLLAARRGLGDADRADLIRLAEQFGLPKHRQDPVFLDALGIAYAGASRFPEAVGANRQALTQMGTAEASAEDNPVSRRLALYENSEPYFEEPGKAAGRSTAFP